MKTLFAVRHAKSSWKHPALSDAERPLNHRGRHDAPLMADRLAARPDPPHHIVTSPAVRTRLTAEAMADALDIPREQIVEEDTLYLASVSELLSVIHHLDNAYHRVILVGHNPGLTDLVHGVTGAPIDNMPTCGIAVIEFDTDAWARVGWVPARLREFDFPKKVV